MLVWGIKLLSQACEANSLPTNLPPMPCFSSFKKVVRRISIIIADFTAFCGVRSQKVRHPSICGGWFLSAWLGRGASWVMRHYCECFCEGIFEWVLWILVWQALSVRWRPEQKKTVISNNTVSWWPRDLNCSVGSYLGLQPAVPPCRFWASMLTQAHEPLPYDLSLFLSLSHPSSHTSLPHYPPPPFSSSTRTSLWYETPENLVTACPSSACYIGDATSRVWFAECSYVRRPAVC